MGVKSELANLSSQLQKARSELASEKLAAAEAFVTNGIDTVKEIIKIWAAKKKKMQDPTQQAKANYQKLLASVSEGKSDKYLAHILWAIADDIVKAQKLIKAD